MESYFTFVVREDNGSDDSALEETGGQLSQEALEQRQHESAGKQEKRTTAMGNLLRTKGYIWMANAHDLVGHFEQAGNTVTLETPELWNALNPKSYSGSEKEKKKLRYVLNKQLPSLTDFLKEHNLETYETKFVVYFDSFGQCHFVPAHTIDRTVES